MTCDELRLNVVGERKFNAELSLGVWLFFPKLMDSHFFPKARLIFLICLLITSLFWLELHIALSQPQTKSAGRKAFYMTFKEHGVMGVYF